MVFKWKASQLPSTAVRVKYKIPGLVNEMAPGRSGSDCRLHNQRLRLRFSCASWEMGKTQNYSFLSFLVYKMPVIIASTLSRL